MRKETLGLLFLEANSKTCLSFLTFDIAEPPPKLNITGNTSEIFSCKRI